MNKILPEVEALVALSHHYGTRWEYVIAGGGNTSWKNDSTLWVKGSGQALGTIQAEGFARMDRKALAALWSRPISSDPVLREKEVLEALMAARLPGEESKRPSVETLLHDLLPFDYVVHTHPTMINALTCSQEGPEVFQRLFALEAVWIAYTDPGYILAQVVKEALEAFRANSGHDAKVIFLQNHGLVVAGDTPGEIRDTYRQLLADLDREVTHKADLSPVGTDLQKEIAFLQALAPIARRELGTETPHVVRSTARAVVALAESNTSFAPLLSAFTPDHIVYMGVSPVRVDSASELEGAFAAYKARLGKAPRVVLAPGLGAFCLGANAKAAGQAQQLFLDAVQIAVASAAFGGPRFLTKAAIDFINHWEVESYRSSVSSK